MERMQPDSTNDARQAVLNLKRARFGAVDVELVKVDLLTLTEMVVSITDIDHILPRRIKILQFVHKNSDL